MAAVPAALLWTVYGCNMGVVYQKALEAHRYELTYPIHRTYAKWVLGNLGDFFLLGGLPTFVYFLAFWSRRGPREERSGLGWKAACVFLGMLLVLDFSGVVRGEAGRIWLFLMIFPTILAANAVCESGRERPLVGLAALGLQYLLVISLQSNAIFLSQF